MAFIAVFEVPGMKSKQYDEAMRALEKAGQGHPAGRLFHVAGPMQGGWYVLDLWDSQEKLNKFAGVLMPIMQKLGVNVPTPKVMPLHNQVRPVVTH